MNVPPRAMPWTLLRRWTAGTFLGLLLLGSGADWPVLRGSMSATRLVERVPFVDPLAATETVLASGSLTGDVLVGAGILLALTLVLGPVFCGWVCPLGLLFDLSQTVRRRWIRWNATEDADADSGPGRSPVSLGVGVFTFLLAFAFVARFPLFQILSPINLVVQAMVFHLLGGLGVVGLLLLIDLRWPRAWCRLLCPVGRLYFLVGSRALFRVRIVRNAENGLFCRRCTLQCPMQIRVMEDYVCRGRSAVGDPQCIRCGACTESCPGRVLRLGFRDPGSKPPPTPITR